jgi:6-pyruvoyltetrahydropterin/6-carboxytetrahydropterin synthase
MNKVPKKVAVFRKEHFNAAHRLFNPSWSDEKIVKLVGEPDPRTGYVMDMKLLSDMIKEHVLSRFDHKNLNMDTEFFRDLNPTAENICIVIYNILRQKIDSSLQIQVRLFETERNFVEFPISPE